MRTSSGYGNMLDDVRRAATALARAVRTGNPRSLNGDEARELASLFAEAERTCASGVALFAPRVSATGSFAKQGHATAPEWLAAVSGSSAASAKARLIAAERATELPEVARALHEGTLSTSQLGIVTSAASADVGAPQTLLELVEGHASHQELAEAAARLRACARSRESERRRREHVRASRHLRWRQSKDGGIRGEFLCDEVEWARVAPALEAAAKARYKTAGPDGTDPFEAHRLDAFLELLGGSGSAAHSRARVLVHVDAEALRRGTNTTGEICEIAGIGPVAVEAVSELLGAASMEFLVKEGADVRTVTKASRDLARKTAAALLARDQTCVVPGCGRRLGLEIDHCTLDYGKGGPTAIENLARLCGPHHAMKTYGGWTISGGPGRWRWTPPREPLSAGAIARAHKVAIAKASRK